MQKLFDLSQVWFADLIDQNQPWLSIEKISEYIEDQRDKLKNQGFQEVGQALIHPTSKIDSSVQISGPVIIDAEAEVSRNAWLREGVIVGKRSFIGLGIEIKRSIILNFTRIPHLSYIADGILGSHVNIGAGTITANWKGGWDDKIVNVTVDSEKISTNQEKFGALIGDNVYLGSNNVTAPGTIIGQNVLSYPLCLLRGEVPANSIVKNKANIEIVDRT